MKRRAVLRESVRSVAGLTWMAVPGKAAIILKCSGKHRKFGATLGKGWRGHQRHATAMMRRNVPSDGPQMDGFRRISQVSMVLCMCGVMATAIDVRQDGLCWKR